MKCVWISLSHAVSTAKIGVETARISSCSTHIVHPCWFSKAEMFLGVGRYLIPTQWSKCIYLHLPPKLPKCSQIDHTHQGFRISFPMDLTHENATSPQPFFFACFCWSIPTNKERTKKNAAVTGQPKNSSKRNAARCFCCKDATWLQACWSKNSPPENADVNTT